ncbi:hypothetical protein [Pseudazoarcus pumilus]|uniref:hypothetical protein n=1 Tax=Pseudazoarcus pumilus TaxID=2067960 RepID=UPI0013D8F0EF|nr:hypothetical protein [Pseudazoarcus pumilus]
MSNLYPAPWDLRESTRVPEEGRLQVDITAAGTARARRRHTSWYFTLSHAHMPEADALTLQAWCETWEGETVTVVWRDGRTYAGVLGVWSVDRVTGADWMANVEIRGAVEVPES